MLYTAGLDAANESKLEMPEPVNHDRECCCLLIKVASNLRSAVGMGAVTS